MLNPKQLLCLVLLVGSFGAATSASAGPIIFFNEYRSVDVVGLGTSSTSEGHFQAAYAVTDRFGISGGTAFQDTMLGGTFVGGSGEVSGGDLRGNVFGTASTLYTEFLLDQDYFADLAFSLFAAGSSSAYLSFFNNDTHNDVLMRSVFNDSEIAAFSGILPAGHYELWLGVDTYRDHPINEPFFGTASFNGGLSLAPLDAAPVPEPASMTMVALGLIGAGARRFRSARKTPRT